MNANEHKSQRSWMTNSALSQLNSECQTLREGAATGSIRVNLCPFVVLHSEWKRLRGWLHYQVKE